MDGFKDARGCPQSRGHTMDWTTIELVSIPEDEGKPVAEPILAGLSAAPSDLHNAFLSDLPHLAEAQAAHANVLTTVSEGVEMHFTELQSIRTAEVAIADLGGFREGDALVLPLAGAIQDLVQLQMVTQGDQTALRLKAEGEQGVALTQTFALPPGTELARAGWRGNDLIFELIHE
mgnify:CR=1 FL=1